MSDISRVALFGKLNSVGYKSVESATVFCKMRGNPYVELVHWLHHDGIQEYHNGIPALWLTLDFREDK